MLSPALLAVRIRGEYREMPGLRLTFAQACRLWQIDAVACESVLQTLVSEHFLVRTTSGAFMALPTPYVARVTPTKAEIEPRRMLPAGRHPGAVRTAAAAKRFE